MRIMILGSFGGSNFGDNLVLHSITTEIKKFECDIVCVVPTPRPERIAHSYGVDAIDINMKRRITYRFLGASVISSLRHCDAVVTTAGILFDRNLWDPRRNFIASVLPVVKVARSKGIRVFGLNVGVTEATTPIGRTILKSVIKSHDIVATRDADSAVLVRALAPATHVVERSDMAHAYLARRHASTATERDGPIGIGLASYLTSFDPRTGSQKTLADRSLVIRKVVQLITQVREITERPVCLVATSISDHLLHCDIARQMNEEVETVALSEMEIPESVEYLSSLSFMVASRLHACICSTSLGIPTLALAYERKVSSYMSAIGADRYVHPFQSILSPQDLARSVQDTLTRGVEIGHMLRKNTLHRGSLAQQSLTDLLKIVCAGDV